MWEGWIRAQLFDILPGTIVGKHFRLKDGFLDVSEWSAQELALKMDLQISTELEKGRLRFRLSKAYLDSQLKGGDLIKMRRTNAFSCAGSGTCRQWKNINFRFRGAGKISGAIRKRAFTGSKTLKHNQFEDPVMIRDLKNFR